jgi:hypothetical protein
VLEKDPANARAGREAVRELGRIAGYVEDIVQALEDHLDGRKLAGVKRRLELLAEKEPMRAAARTTSGRPVPASTAEETSSRARRSDTSGACCAVARVSRRRRAGVDIPAQV